MDIELYVLLGLLLIEAEVDHDRPVVGGIITSVCGVVDGVFRDIESAGEVDIVAAGVPLAALVLLIAVGVVGGDGADTDAEVGAAVIRIRKGLLEILRMGRLGDGAVHRQG